MMLKCNYSFTGNINTKTLLPKFDGRLQRLLAECSSGSMYSISSYIIYSFYWKLEVGWTGNKFVAAISFLFFFPEKRRTSSSVLNLVEYFALFQIALAQRCGKFLFLTRPNEYV